MRKNEKVIAVSNIIKAVLQKRYGDILVSTKNAETVLNTSNEGKALLEASLPILRFFVLRFLTKTFETISLVEIAKYLDLK